MPYPDLYMVFDVESIGLHGEAFAVGWVIIDRVGKELDSGLLACDPEHAKGSQENRRWVDEHVYITNLNCITPYEVRQFFWQEWVKNKARGCTLAAEVPWPVEARFLTRCVNDFYDVREWQGPYPLIDIASVRLAVGEDPLISCIRLENERPEHNPLCDARQSARLLIEALGKYSG